MKHFTTFILLLISLTAFSQCTATIIADESVYIESGGTVTQYFPGQRFTFLPGEDPYFYFFDGQCDSVSVFVTLEIEGELLPLIGCCNAIGNPCDQTTMPVEFLSYKATAMQYGALMQWSATESGNVDNYQVQRSQDGQNWNTIAEIESGKERYQYQDRTFFEVIYYRILSNSEGVTKHTPVMVVQNKRGQTKTTMTQTGIIMHATGLYNTLGQTIR